MTGQIHFTVEQVEKLLAMQDQLNSYIHPEWKKQNFDWNFAIIDECREIKEHLGWKWWKENYQCGLTEQNRKQVQLEVIDILHFVLSCAAETGGIIKASLYTEWLNNGNQWNPSDLNEAVGYMLEECVTQSSNIYESWTTLAILSGLTTEQVIETYTQKFVLNKFRQDHGYKDGSYCKEWENWYPYVGGHSLQTLEDNEVLSLLVSRFTSLGWDTTDEQALYKELELLYNSRLNK